MLHDEDDEDVIDWLLSQTNGNDDFAFEDEDDAW